MAESRNKIQCQPPVDDDASIVIFIVVIGSLIALSLTATLWVVNRIHLLIAIICTAPLLTVVSIVATLIFCLLYGRQIKEEYSE